MGGVNERRREEEVDEEAKLKKNASIYFFDTFKALCRLLSKNKCCGFDSEQLQLF